MIIRRAAAIFLAAAMLVTSVPAADASVVLAAEATEQAVQEEVAEQKEEQQEEQAQEPAEAQQEAPAVTEAEPVVTEPASEETTAAVEEPEAPSTTVTEVIEPETTTTTEAPVKAESVKAQKDGKDVSEITVKIGSEQALAARVLPEDAEDKEIVWSSANSGVAEVDENGTVKGIAAGVTTITAALASDASIKAQVKVTVSTGDWVKGTGKNKKKWKFRKLDGTFAKNEFIVDGDQTYYIGSDQYLRTGLFTVNKKTYYASSSGAIQKDWTKVSNKWYYFDPEDGFAASKGWKELPNSSGEQKWYYFDASSGVLKTGWFKVSGKNYYANSSGEMQKGWLTISKTTTKTVKKKKVTTTTYSYYYLDPETGARKSGWQKIDDRFYYFDSNGVNQKNTGWQKLSKIYYYFAKDEDSHVYAVTGWKKLSGNWYYMDPSDSAHGKMVTGWKTIDGKTYYFNSKGASVTGIQTISKKKYLFLDEDGAGVLAADGWNTSEGTYYYIQPTDHAIAFGAKTFDGKQYYFDTKTGVAKQGIITINKKRYLYLPDESGIPCRVEKAGRVEYNGKPYFLNEDFTVAKGWVKEGDDYYYFGESSIVTGWYQVNKKWYYFDTETGKMQKGWLYLSSGRYYMDPVNGDAWLGDKTVDGARYYFDTETCGAQRGIVKVGKEYYAYDLETYQRVTGKAGTFTDQYGYQCKIDGNGKLTSAISKELAMTIKAQSATSETNYLIMVNKSDHKIGVFKKAGSEWKMVKGLWNIHCGSKSHPSKSGKWRTTKAYHEFWRDFNGSTAFYCTYTTGSYFLHSRLYKKGSRSPSGKSPIDPNPDKGGKNISHSCIRLQLANAQWVYNNIPASTRVWVY